MGGGRDLLGSESLVDVANSVAWSSGCDGYLRGKGPSLDRGYTLSFDNLAEHTA